MASTQLLSSNRRRRREHRQGEDQSGWSRPHHSATIRLFIGYGRSNLFEGQVSRFAREIKKLSEFFALRFGVAVANAFLDTLERGM